MIKGIIFDCFGVLYGGSLSLLVSMAPQERATEVIDINKQNDYGILKHEDYLEQTAVAIGTSKDEVSRIIRTTHARNEPLVAYAYELSRDYKIGLLSNVGEHTIDALWSKEELDELFTAVVLSYQEGIVKPHPEIFRLTAERMGLRPEECVMIDDLADNCEGAEVSGMQSIQHVTNQYTKERLQQILQQ